MSRRVKTTLITISVLAILLIVLFLNLNFQKVDDYYSSSSDSKLKDHFSVTMSIDCSVILDNMDSLPDSLKKSNLLPVDGIMLPKMSFEVKTNKSVFDLLIKGTKQNKIQMEYSGNPDGGISSVYIKSIGHLYEFSCGPLSGWMFRVNGEFAGNDASGHTLTAGDEVEWIFTCDLGKDVGNEFDGGK